MPSTRIPPGYNPDYNHPIGVDERLWSALLVGAFLGSFAWGALGSSLFTLSAMTALAALYIDSLSYGMHNILDNYRFASFPPLRRIATEFQVHHVRPGDVVKRGYLRNNTYELCFYVGLPLALPALFFERGTALNIFFLASGVWTSFIPTVHAWAHQPRHPNRLVAALQKSGLILSPGRHSRHHRGLESEFRAYSLLNGWTNSFLDLFFAGARDQKTLDQRSADYR